MRFTRQLGGATALIPKDCTAVGCTFASAYAKRLFRISPEPPSRFSGLDADTAPGLVLGFEDASALTLLVWHPHSGNPACWGWNRRGTSQQSHLEWAASLRTQVDRLARASAGVLKQFFKEQPHRSVGVADATWPCGQRDRTLSRAQPFGCSGREVALCGIPVRGGPWVESAYS